MCVDLDFFRRVVDFARAYDISIVHDFSYADLVFDGYRAPSLLQVPGGKEVGIEFFSMSDSPRMALKLTELRRVVEDRFYLASKQDCETLATRVAKVDAKRSIEAMAKRCRSDRWLKQDLSCYHLALDVSQLEHCDQLAPKTD